MQFVKRLHCLAVQFVEQTSMIFVLPRDFGMEDRATIGPNVHHQWVPVNAPVVTYGLDQSFLEFLRNKRHRRGGSAIKILNDLLPFCVIPTNYRTIAK